MAAGENLLAASHLWHLSMVGPFFTYLPSRVRRMARPVISGRHLNARSCGCLSASGLDTNRQLQHLGSWLMATLAPLATCHFRKDHQLHSHHLVPFAQELCANECVGFARQRTAENLPKVCVFIKKCLIELAICRIYWGRHCKTWQLLMAQWWILWSCSAN